MRYWRIYHRFAVIDFNQLNNARFKTSPIYKCRIYMAYDYKKYDYIAMSMCSNQYVKFYKSKNNISIFTLFCVILYDTMRVDYKLRRDNRENWFFALIENLWLFAGYDRLASLIVSTYSDHTSEI